MRIVSFNVQHARTPSGGVDTAALARTCAGFGADVLCLQEVDDRMGRSGLVDQTGEVVLATGMMSVFGVALEVGGGRYGNVLLVRGVLADTDTLSLPRLADHEPRAAVLAAAEVDGVGALSLAGVHLAVDPAEHAEQLAAVLEALAARPGPRVLLGDCNMGPERARPLLEAAGFTVADTTDPTFPAAHPRERIDHVAVQGLAVVAVEVLPAAPVSDHRPLLVEAR